MNPIKIKPSRRGLLHEKLGIPKSKKIPESDLKVEPNDSTALKKEKVFAKNAKSWKH